MPQISHAYAIGRVRALSRTLISRQTLDRLISSENPQDVARVLTESGWGEAQDQRGVEHLADSQVRQACDLIKRISPEPDVTDCFLLKYDILNLKTLLKARLLNQPDPPLSENGILDVERLRHAVNEGNYSQVSPEIRAAMEEIERRVAVEADPLFIDVRLDKLLFEMIARRLAHAKSCAEVKKYFSAMADRANILSALRVNRMGRDEKFARTLFVPMGNLKSGTLCRIAREPASLLPCVEKQPYAPYIRRALARIEKGEGLAAIETEMDDYLTGLLTPRRYDVASILPLIGYLVAREREASVVRLISAAKAVSAPEESYAPKVRKLYQ